MATTETALYASQKSDRANPTRLADANVASGEVEVAVIPYALSGSEAASDTIDLCLLPKDCIPVPALSYVVCDNPGTALVIDIGTAEDADGWADGMVLSAGGEVKANSAANSAWNAATKLAADDTTDNNTKVFATVQTANSLTADADLYFVLAFKRGR